MIIGIPKEIKNNENRVAITPAGVHELSSMGHQIIIEAGAGTGSGFSDMEYTAAGATILKTAAEIYASADTIVKVKEPLEEEYPLMKEGQVLFTYLHLVRNTFNGKLTCKGVAEALNLEYTSPISLLK